MKINQRYKHERNKDVYLCIRDIYLQDDKISIYLVEWFNISTNGFIGNDQIKVKHEDEQHWGIYNERLV